MARNKESDEVFCASCGEMIKRDAEICPHCGVRNQEPNGNQTSSITVSDTDDIIDHVTTYAPYAAWGFGGLFILAGIAGLFNSPITGIVTILTGAVLFPPSREKLEEWLDENYDVQLTRWMIVGIVLVGLAIAGATAPTTNAVSAAGGQSQQISQAVQGVQVRVSYSGSWSGAISTVGGTRSISGFGTTTYTIEGNPSIVSITAQKRGGNGGKLTIQILNDGAVVAEQSTSAKYGVAQVSERI